MSQPSLLQQKWAELLQAFDENQDILDDESLHKIHAMLTHDEPSYMTQGWQLLLSFGAEQLCRYVRLDKIDETAAGFLCLKGGLENIEYVDQTLLLVLDEFPELLDLYVLKAFEMMEWQVLGRFSLGYLPTSAKKKMLRKSRKMVLIPKGTFVMGALQGDPNAETRELPRREVTLSRDFWMGKYPVTQGLWETVMQNYGSSAGTWERTGSRPSYFKGCTHPVESVTWLDCIHFCNRLSQMKGLTEVYTIEQTKVQCDWTANGYRLPTEAEWEYAAKVPIEGVEPTLFAGGNDMHKVLWCETNTSQTQPVGLKGANGFGLYDMSGNVWEWVWDGYAEFEDIPQIDPTGAEGKQLRVKRGGSWQVFAGEARVSSRSYLYAARKSKDLGFRVARNVTNAKSDSGA